MASLSEEEFEVWWNVSVRASDQQEYVHGPWRGTLESAKFCCVYDKLRLGEDPRDIIVTAYVQSQGLRPEQSKSPAVRIAAQGMYEEDAVQFLLDRVEYRKRAEAEERVHAIAVEKMDELRMRCSNEDAFGEYKDKLFTEKLLMDSALRYLADRTKQKAVDMQRRERRALQKSLEEGKKQLKNVTQLPSKDEIRQFFAMARDMLTEAEFEELSGRKALGDGGNDAE